MIGDSNLLHRPGEQDHLALERDGEDMRSEVAPMIEPAQIENVLGRGDQQQLQVSLGHDAAKPLKPALEFRRRKIGWN